MAESHVTIWKNEPADAGLDTVKKISRGKVNIRLTGVITRQDLISVGHIRCQASTILLHPLPSTWVIVQSPVVPIMVSPSVSSPQNGTAQLIQEDFLRSQTFWDRALRRGGRTFMFWHLPHQWTDRLAGWAKLFAFCRQFSLFHSFSPRCQRASLDNI